MNSPNSVAQDGCAACSPNPSALGLTGRCVSCDTKGDLVGQVVWDYVSRSVREAGQNDRVTYMLAGLPAIFLEGIARKAPNAGRSIETRSLLLAMNPEAAPNLQVQAPARSSKQSAVHWRHSTEAQVILFAPSDAEREGIGAGLGPLARLDGQTIEEQTEAWLAILGETDDAGGYLKAMLEGLRASQIYVDLEMWVDFILAIKVQGFALPVHLRVQAAAPALHIPQSGIVKLPTYKAGENYRSRRQDFRSSFQAARSEVAVYAGLMTPKQEPVDLDAVRAAIDAYEHNDEAELLEALEATKALLDDEPNIRPGEWRESQRKFCEKVSWDRVGAYLFSGARKVERKSLGEQTRSFIEGNYSDDVIADDLQLLETMKDAAPKDINEDELEFFTRWQERLNQPEVIKLYKAWQKRLFSKQVIGHDLIETLSEGFEALAIAGSDKLPEMVDPRILIRTTQHKKKMFWEKLDVAVQQLFRFELRAAMGLLSGRIYWDLDACFAYNAEAPASSAEHRKIDLELYLVDAAEMPDPTRERSLPHSVPRVKATWQPGVKPKHEPISLALPSDITDLNYAAQNDAGLFRAQTFAPRGGLDESRIFSTTLSDTNSFSDVTQGQNGRTFGATEGSNENLLRTLKQRISELAETHSLEPAAAEALTAAVKRFEEAYIETVIGLEKDPEALFASDTIDRQANAFGALCRACREHSTNQRAKLELRPLVAGLGIVAASGHTPLAIIAAWHPLRLAERRARLQDLANFIEAVLSSSQARNDDLTIAFEERRALASQWIFPQVAVVDGQTMVAIEDVNGYSLLVPADCDSRIQEALEGSSPAAAEKFIEGVTQYLDIHPHEATNLSAAIFDSESQSLPQEIARLMAQRIHRDPELRCDLVITHQDQSRMREIYRAQNMRLGAENISSGAKGFLSRLRVDVRPNQSGVSADETIRDMDLVFLHDAISRHAKPIWDFERGTAEDLPEAFDLAGLRSPRKRLGEANAPGVGVYLSLPRPPRAVAEYQDLLYEMGKDAILPQGCHGVLIRQVNLDDANVRDLLLRAHSMAEWVVSFDKISGRSLLEKSGIQIIRDISVPGSNSRVIISAGRVDERLKANLREDLIKCCGTDAATASQLVDVVLQDVLQISGQKVLAAARFANASREMIGLSVMRAVLESSLPQGQAGLSQPIWFSLDDYRGWFVSGSGKIADAVAMTVLDQADGFELIIQVGEAKFISLNSQQAETKDAQQQVRDTVARLRRIFVDNHDPISRSAWCTRLADLLVNRDGLSERLPDPIRRAAFLECLSRGDVRFRISGDAVICLHDDHGTQPVIEQKNEIAHLRHIVLTTPIIRKALNATAASIALDLPGLQDVAWLSSGDAQEETPSSNVGTAPHPQDTKDDKTVEQIPPAPQVDKPEEVAAECIAPAIETGDPTADEERDSADQDPPERQEPVSRFIPAPLRTALTEMAARETGAIDDPASVEWAKAICEDTQRALSRFDMQAHFADPPFRLTPNGALVTFKGHDTLTVERINRRKNELLTTHGIEVIDVRPGRGQISLFIKREKRAMVPLASTWLAAPWPEGDAGKLNNFILGAREDDDHLLYLNIAGEYAGYEEHAPHTLIAGETKSGKGVLTQSLLLQLIAFNSPREVELILIDPKKGVDFGWLKGAPHMRENILTDIDEAENAIDSLVQLMDERYELLAQEGAPNIDYYNRKVPADKRMSRIYLVHDEMGAWMAQEKEYREVVLTAVANLGMKARAAGIHLILITQRADADAIPTKLRDNMGNRLCLKVQNSTGSRMVGVSGAERLLGKGHLACVLANESPPPGQEVHLAQVPFCEPDDLFHLAQTVINYWKHQES
tara:strand:+ start:27013 stop:32535 length:5523 start_codon:yes stop_codon:yes gene_type:complete